MSNFNIIISSFFSIYRPMPTVGLSQNIRKNIEWFPQTFGQIPPNFRLSVRLRPSYGVGLYPALYYVGSTVCLWIKWLPL